jgi:hypothetical protein
MDDGLRGHRFDLVVDRGQFLVVGVNQLRRLLRDMRVLRQHHGHRLAHVMHLAERQDRLVVEGGAIIGLRDDLEDVLAGIDAEDAGYRRRIRRVDGFDPALRHRAAKDLGVQHAGNPHRVDVFRPTRHLVAGFETRDRMPDHRGSPCRHQPASPSSARRTARATVTRNNSRL